MITLPTSRAAGKTGSKASPSRSRRRGGARCKAFAAVAAAALVGYAGAAGAGLPIVKVPFLRVALVIGNGDYEDSRVHSDASARTDAAGVAAALERLRFKVRHLEDAGYMDMLQGLLEFSEEAQSARAAVVFYAGQGTVVGSRNHLIPVNARRAALEALGRDPDLDPGHHVTEGNLGLIPVKWLMRSVAGASKLRLVVLDAYVPAPLEQAGETIVALAAGVGVPPGSGEHRASGHSPYTEALLRHLEEPGLELGMLLRKVREDVMQATDGGQEPVVYWPGSGVSLSPLPLSGRAPVVDPDEAAKPGRAEAEAVVELGTPFRVDAEEAVPPQAPGTTFRDCPECPEMVEVPPGRFRMGSPPRRFSLIESPEHLVTIGYRLAVGVNEVTRGEFARFVSATGRSMGSSCLTVEGGDELQERSGHHWTHPGFRQTDSHPVVCVSWDDAKAYVEWLSRETGEDYRLLSESEWEYVARAGTETARYWGASSLAQCRYANGADEALERRHADWKWENASCDDGHAKTAPVGSFSPNAFGLHDVYGNVREWVEDCRNDSYRGAPADGRAWTTGVCGHRMLRGGSWANYPGNLRSAARGFSATGNREGVSGIRIARTLTLTR